MSFNITIQVNSSENNKLDKTLTDIATLSGTLKQETSIIDPIIAVEGNLSDYIGANYCTIPTFGRSYFINNIRSIRNGIFEISCHVDVLSSFKTQIRANSAIIHKSERNWNLYLNDGSLKTYQNPIIYTKKFSSGFPEDTEQYILGIAGS